MKLGEAGKVSKLEFYKGILFFVVYLAILATAIRFLT